MQTRKNPIMYILLAIVIGVVFWGIIFFNRKGTSEVKKDDREKFSSTVEHFNILEEMALEGMRLRDTIKKERFLLNLKETALLDWAECVNVLDMAEKLNLPPYIESYRLHLIDYSNHRLQQTLLLIKATEEQTEKYRGGMDSIQKKINEVKVIIKKEKPSFD